MAQRLTQKWEIALRGDSSVPQGAHGLSALERMSWRWRLFWGRWFRFYVHLPIFSSDPRGRLTEISAVLRYSVIEDIEVFLAEKGEDVCLSGRIEGGLYKGHPEINLVLYLDHRACLEDIQWFYVHTRLIWRVRLNQESIYLTWRRIGVRRP